MRLIRPASRAPKNSHVVVGKIFVCPDCGAVFQIEPDDLELNGGWLDPSGNLTHFVRVCTECSATMQVPFESLADYAPGS